MATLEEISMSPVVDGFVAGWGESFLEIPLAALLDHCDPTTDNPWGCGHIDPQDVYDEIDLLQFRKPAEYDIELYENYGYNVGRIAYLLSAGWQQTTEDSEPITVDIGLEGYTPGYLIMDGNHRVAAAKLRGDRTILVSISGDLDKAEAVFLRGVHPDEYRFAVED